MELLKQSIETYLQTRDKIIISPDDVDYSVARKYVPFFRSIDQSETSIIAVFDYMKKNILYISDRFFDIFGFDKSHTLNFEHIYVRNLIHPDDYFINEAGAISLEYIRNQPGNDKKNLRFIADFRMKNNFGKWFRITLQDMILETDKKGNPWLNLKLFDFSPFQDTDNTSTCSLRNMNTGEIIFSFDERAFKKTISKREKEVLEMIADGFRSKEIAEKLFISVNTVNIHRRNAIEKLNASNSSEAIKRAIKLNLI